MRVLLVLTAAALALSACGRAEQKTYPPEYQLNFMHACTAQASAPGYCACVWDKIEANISPADFAALEDLPAAARDQSPVQHQIVAYASACRPAETDEPPDAPATP